MDSRQQVQGTTLGPLATLGFLAFAAGAPYLHHQLNKQDLDLDDIRNVFKQRLDGLTKELESTRQRIEDINRNLLLSAAATATTTTAPTTTTATTTSTTTTTTTTTTSTTTTTTTITTTTTEALQALELTYPTQGASGCPGAIDGVRDGTKNLDPITVTPRSDGMCYTLQYPTSFGPFARYQNAAGGATGFYNCIWKIQFPAGYDALGKGAMWKLSQNNFEIHGACNDDFLKLSNLKTTGGINAQDNDSDDNEATAADGQVRYCDYRSGGTRGSFVGPDDKLLSVEPDMNDQIEVEFQASSSGNAAGFKLELCVPA